MIRVRGLGKSFAADGRSVKALDGVGFEVAGGRFVSLVGPSGCGKSTLLGILAGVAGWDEGDVAIDGKTVKGPRPDHVGMVFQEPLLLPWKTTVENIAFPLVLRGVEPDLRRERSRELVQLVGLAGFEDAYPGELSVGMRQRAAIARGLALDPPVVLMDEPFAALDEQSRLRMGHELLGIWERTRKTVLFVTHSLSEAVYLADTVLVMSARPGRIVDSVAVGLPRPRRLEMLGGAELGRMRNHIWSLIGSCPGADGADP